MHSGHIRVPWTFCLLMYLKGLYKYLSRISRKLHLCQCHNFNEHSKFGLILTSLGWSLSVQKLPWTGHNVMTKLLAIAGHYEIKTKRKTMWVSWWNHIHSKIILFLDWIGCIPDVQSGIYRSKSGNSLPHPGHLEPRRSCPRFVRHKNTWSDPTTHQTQTTSVTLLRSWEVN